MQTTTRLVLLGYWLLVRLPVALPCLPAPKSFILLASCTCCLNRLRLDPSCMKIQQRKAMRHASKRHSCLQIASGGVGYMASYMASYSIEGTIEPGRVVRGGSGSKPLAGSQSCSTWLASLSRCQSRPAKTIIRKAYHLLAVVLFVPGQVRD